MGKKPIGLTTFLERARVRHGDRFDYSASRWIGFTKPITIVCREHGPCETTPKSHLVHPSGGCASCRKQLVHNALTLNTDDFVRRAKEIHGARYDYRLVNCTGASVPVIIVCPEHGPFCMRPGRHLSGRGCRKCALIRIHRERKPSFWDFVERVITAHGANRYDYELKDFVTIHSKISIECPKHGKFLQTVTNHLQGHGCPRCVQSAGEQQIREALQILEVEFVEQAKFPECRNRRPLRFDFYVPSQRLLVEFDGRQHYEISESWGGEKKFEETKHCDAIKNRFAVEHGYRLLRIPFYEYDNIETILLEQLTSDVTYERGDDDYAAGNLCSAG